jgi:hypothetical protein
LKRAQVNAYANTAFVAILYGEHRKVSGKQLQANSTLQKPSGSKFDVPDSR